METLVGTDNDALRPVGMMRDLVLRGQPLGMAGGTRGGGADDQTVAVLHQRVAKGAKLRLLARPWRRQQSFPRALRRGCRLMTSISPSRTTFRICRAQAFIVACDDTGFYARPRWARRSPADSRRSRSTHSISTSPNWVTKAGSSSYLSWSIERRRSYSPGSAER